MADVRMTSYVVVPAPGHYGHETTVLSAHETAPDAIRAALAASRVQRYVARANAAHGAGDRWLPVYGRGESHRG